MLFSPVELNAALKGGFAAKGWAPVKRACEYPTEFYEPGYEPRRRMRGAYREMDFVKEKLGVEVQFGKYAFMVYNVCAKMTIFHNFGIIDTGIEVVPIKNFVDEMSSGVSYFEQFVWDLEARGVSNIDIPVLILGIDADDAPPLQPATTPSAQRKVTDAIDAPAVVKKRNGARPGPKPRP